MKGEQQTGEKRMYPVFKQQDEEEVQADDDGQMQNQVRIVESFRILCDLIVEPHGKTNYGTIFSIVELEPAVELQEHRQGIENVLEVHVFQKMRIVVRGERSRHALLVTNERDDQCYRQ